MGWLDRAKQWLSGDAEDDNSEEAVTTAAPHEAGARGGRGAARDGRPALKDIAPPPQIGIDEVLEARAAGDFEGARRILREVDRGRGLRTVLRAAAALEADDEREVASLLDAIAKEEPAHRLPLQVAAALGDPEAAAPYLERAAEAGAPAWALAWSRALSDDATTRREGLVELLFADAPLARTVAARDLAIEGAEADPLAAKRYASFAHGRDSIRAFGAPVVARLLDRAGVGRRA